jgi:hypothetical protein
MSMTKQLFTEYQACETVTVDVLDLQAGDMIWLNRKVRGLGGADTIALLVSDVTLDGGLALFEHLILWPVERPGKWYAATGRYDRYDKIVLPD